MINHKSKLDDSDLLNSVLYFSAGFCAPCRTLKPMLESISSEYDSLQFIHIDIEESPEIAMKHHVMAIPTVSLFINGEEKERFTGLRNKADYEKAFSAYAG